MGCGASNTTGRTSEKIPVQQERRVVHTEPARRVRDHNEWPEQPGHNVDDHENNKVQESQPARDDRRNAAELNDLFYNEDYFIQLAMQESLMNQDNNEDRNEDEIFNALIKDTLVMSKKEYDDIDRKAKEDEIEMIKDNPDLMKKKIENLLDKRNIAPASKKLPPLEMINKNLKAKKPKEKIDLETIKAPILRQQPTEPVLVTDRGNDRNEINDTESEIDIRGAHNFNDDPVVPSYNIQLLNDQKNQQRANIINDNQFMSLQSNEFGVKDSVNKFEKPQNENGEYLNKNDEYQKLINYLDDDEDDKNRNKHSAQQSTLDLNHKPYEIKKLNSKDSFDDLINDLNIDDDPVKEHLNTGGGGKQEIEDNDDDNFDDFEF